MTYILRTLNGAPLHITSTRDQAEESRVSDFHHVTPDIGGRNFFSGGLYDAGERVMGRPDAVTRYGRDMLAEDLEREIRRYWEVNA